MFSDHFATRVPYAGCTMLPDPKTLYLCFVRKHHINQMMILSADRMLYMQLRLAILDPELERVMRAAGVGDLSPHVT